MTDLDRLGDRVRRLRVGLGLGQVELGDRVGLSSGSISMLENGRLPVTPATIEALSSVLDCEPSFLVLQIDEPRLSKPQLRAYADASKKTVDQAVADGVTALEVADFLALKRVPDSLPLFDGDPSNDEAIEEVAADTRSAAGLEPDQPVGNSIRAAERLGCVVLPLDSELGRHLGLSFRVESTPVIRVSRSSEDPDAAVPGDRQRFTVSHELGHLVLHHSAPQPTGPVDAGRAEREAHRFASSFLAPGEAVLHDLTSLGGRVTLSTLATLKAKWGFSIKAFVVRFQQLGVIDEAHARSLYKQISSRKWNKTEPITVETEAAVWMEKALRVRAKDQGTAVDNVIHQSGLGSRYFDRWTDWTPTPSNESLARVTALTGERRRPGSQLSTRGHPTVTALPFRPSR
jgi:Zn-dependent peptidase ImmA (M78 family)/transcriptional regulator with XRE-family HTH domain